jgi:hypothetical protein
MIVDNEKDGSAATPKAQSAGEGKQKEEENEEGAYSIPPALMELNLSHNLIKDVCSVYLILSSDL